MRRIKSWCNPDPYTAEIIEGTTLTIPNQAPTMIEILACAVEGQPLPVTSSPLFDDSDESGSARVDAHNIPTEKVFQQRQEYYDTRPPHDEVKVPTEGAAKAAIEEETATPEEQA